MIEWVATERLLVLKVATPEPSSGLEVLEVKFVSPPYTAVIECVAAARSLVLKVATPEPSRLPVPRVAARP